MHANEINPIETTNIIKEPETNIHGLETVIEEEYYISNNGDYLLQQLPNSSHQTSFCYESTISLPDSTELTPPTNQSQNSQENEHFKLGIVDQKYTYTNNNIQSSNSKNSKSSINSNKCILHTKIKQVSSQYSSPTKNILESNQQSKIVIKNKNSKTINIETPLKQKEIKELSLHYNTLIESTPSIIIDINTPIKKITNPENQKYKIILKQTNGQTALSYEIEKYNTAKRTYNGQMYKFTKQNNNELIFELHKNQQIHNAQPITQFQISTKPKSHTQKPYKKTQQHTDEIKIKLYQPTLYNKKRENITIDTKQERSSRPSNSTRANTPLSKPIIQNSDMKNTSVSLLQINSSILLSKSPIHSPVKKQFTNYNKHLQTVKYLNQDHHPSCTTKNYTKTKPNYDQHLKTIKVTNKYQYTSPIITKKTITSRTTKYPSTNQTIKNHPYNTKTTQNHISSFKLYDTTAYITTKPYHTKQKYTPQITQILQNAYNKIYIKTNYRN